MLTPARNKERGREGDNGLKCAGNVSTMFQVGAQVRPTTIGQQRT